MMVHNVLFHEANICQGPVFILMYSIMELLLGKHLMLCTYKWKIDYWHVQVWLWKVPEPGDRTHWICSSESLCRDWDDGATVLIFPSLLQFSPGHCARWWRCTASSLATQSTGMWTCRLPLTASFGSGPSTPTWTLYITTTATEMASIITEIPSQATPPHWGG